MACTPIYQPIAGQRDVKTFADIQDHWNRSVQNWMQEICRLRRLETTVPGSTNDERDNVVPGTIWINTSTNLAYVNVDNLVGAAIWVLVSGTGGPAIVSTATTLSNSTAAGVPDNTETTVYTYTAVGSDSKITKIVVSGQDNALWHLNVDSVTKIVFRTADGNRSRDMDFPIPFLLPTGSTLDIKVKHFFTGSTLDFQASVVGYT